MRKPNGKSTFVDWRPRFVHPFRGRHSPGRASLLGQMNNMIKNSSLLIILLLLVGSISAETIVAVCYSPSGTRFEMQNGEMVDGPDGFSNSNPTFFYNSEDPEWLVESWESAILNPETITREQLDEIDPPSASRSFVLLRTENVIHAIYLTGGSEGGEGYTTTLYPNHGVGIFTRVDTSPDGSLLTTLSDPPMGALYVATCTFNVIE